MQNQSSLNQGSAATNLYQKISRFFRADPSTKLFNKQPEWQRRLFLQRATEQALNIFIQILPVSKEGKVTNITGRIHQLSHDRFLVHNNNVDYFFNFNQVQYLINLS
ncbi:hypothetical protein [Limosilactobacillus sp.]|uniref:hypothetical protein n=1 Tax=Limosilactobacillus sp. TaxID=2773925 RepID=UPI00345E61DD